MSEEALQAFLSPRPKSSAKRRRPALVTFKGNGLRNRNLSTINHKLSKLFLGLEQPEGVAVADLGLSGCLGVITHPKIFKRPPPLPVALQFIESLRNLHSVRVAGLFSQRPPWPLPPSPPRLWLL